jgi:hypothetical protein
MNRFRLAGLVLLIAVGRFFMFSGKQHGSEIVEAEQK